jgi:hypothetical protein
MDTFFPFIHKIEKKKKEELQPLYIELEPPPLERKQKSEEDEEAPRVVIIEL